MTESRWLTKRVVVLSGGVGGARLVHGLTRAVSPENLTAIVNTGDDFEHWGLKISPDLDTVMYTLSGLAPEERGWGLKRETFSALEMVGRYGGPDWFRLGDRDLATHLMRSQALRSGERLTEVTARLCRALDVKHRVLPMCDEPRRTMIETADETLIFNDWFVKLRCEPRVERVHYEGATEATPEVYAALEAADLIIIAPSNPYVSIDPILTLSGVREAVAKRSVVAVSPIVGGKAVKGPLAEMIRSIEDVKPSASAVAAHYGDLVHGWAVEPGDVDKTTMRDVLPTDTIMTRRSDREWLARELLAYAVGLL